MCAVVQGTQPFELKRVTALIGPYGSGKTELALGLAHLAAQAAREVGGAPLKPYLGDLDVIKPYFRSREAGARLREAGVTLLAPQGALAQADLPIVTAELRGCVARRDTLVVLDVGGDPVGARVLGSLRDAVGDSEYDLLLVLNRFRPFMDGLESVAQQVRSMVAATGLQLTGVVSNTHLFEETSVSDVRWGLALSQDVARAFAVAVRLLGLPAALVAHFASEPGLPPIIGIQRQMMPSFLGGVVLARSAPSATGAT